MSTIKVDLEYGAVNLHLHPVESHFPEVELPLKLIFFSKVTGKLSIILTSLAVEPAIRTT